MLGLLLARPLLALPLLAPAPAAAPAAPQAPARVDVLETVPADAFAVLHVESVSELRRALAASQWVKFLTSDAGVAGAFDAPELARLATLLDPDAPAETRAGLGEEEREVLEWVDLVRGGVAIYVSGSPDDDRAVFGAVFEPGPTLPELARRLAAHLEREGAVTVTQGPATVTLPSEALGDPSQTEGALIAMGDRVVVLGGPGRDGTAVHAELQRVIGVLSGAAESPSVLDNPRFAAARAGLRTDGQVLGFVDLQPIVRLLPEPSEQTDPLDPDPGTVIDFLGVREVGWAALAFRVGPVEELDLEFAAHVPNGTWLAKLADNLKPLRLDRFQRVPGDAIAAGAWNIDVYGLYRTLIAGANAWQDGLGELLSVQLTEFGSTAGVDLEEDLLGVLTGEGVTYTPPSRPAATDGASTEARAMEAIAEAYPAYWIGVSDPETLRYTLEDLALFGMEQGGLPPMDFVSTERDGVTLHSLPAEAGFPLFWSWAADALVVGLDGDRVAQLAKGASAGVSVLEDPQLGPHLAAHGGAAALSIGRTAETLGAVRDAFGSLAGLAMLTGGSGAREATGVSRSLADVAIESFFSGVSVSTLERGSGSIHLRYFTR